MPLIARPPNTSGARVSSTITYKCDMVVLQTSDLEVNLVVNEHVHVIQKLWTQRHNVVPSDVLVRVLCSCADITGHGRATTHSNVLVLDVVRVVGVETRVQKSINLEP